jgi:SAM-dependent methyltransferase
MTISNESVNRITAKWLRHAPHLWWGDRLDARFIAADAVRSLTGARVLDIGCNAGILLSEIPHSNRRFGLDRSASALQLAQQLNPSAAIVCGDMQALPYGDSAMSAVVYCGMLELPSQDRKAAAIQEMARVLTAGGRLYLTTVNRHHRRYRHATTIHAVTLEELRTLLSPYFDVTIRGFNPFPPFPYFLPNAMLAAVPGIWRLLTACMARDIGLETCCMFYVEGVRKARLGQP